MLVEVLGSTIETFRERRFSSNSYKTDYAEGCTIFAGRQTEGRSNQQPETGDAIDVKNIMRRLVDYVTKLNFFQRKRNRHESGFSGHKRKKRSETLWTSSQEGGGGFGGLSNGRQRNVSPGKLECQ